LDSIGLGRARAWPGAAEAVDQPLHRLLQARVEVGELAAAGGPSSLEAGSERLHRRSPSARPWPAASGASLASMRAMSCSRRASRSVAAGRPASDLEAWVARLLEAGTFLGRTLPHPRAVRVSRAPGRDLRPAAGCSPAIDARRMAASSCVSSSRLRHGELRLLVDELRDALLEREDRLLLALVAGLGLGLLRIISSIALLRGRDDLVALLRGRCGPARARASSTMTSMQADDLSLRDHAHRARARLHQLGDGLLLRADIEGRLDVLERELHRRTSSADGRLDLADLEKRRFAADSPAQGRRATDRYSPFAVFLAARPRCEERDDDLLERLPLFQVQPLIGKVILPGSAARPPCG
jgi:hypothetical protein